MADERPCSWLSALHRDVHDDRRYSSAGMAYRFGVIFLSLYGDVVYRPQERIEIGTYTFSIHYCFSKDDQVKHFVISALAVGLLTLSGIAGCSSAKDDKKATGDDAQKAAGTWTLVSGETEGAPLPEKEVANAKLTIVGDKYTVKLGDASEKKGTQKLDSAKTPKHIDAQDTEGPTVGKNLGIYEFTADGDFRVCFAATGKERPTEFVTKPGSGHFMHLWRRAK